MGYEIELTTLTSRVVLCAYGKKSTTNEYRPSRGTAFVSRTFCPAARKEGACHQMFEGKICPKLGPIFHHNIPKYSFRILEVM
jgi:hypothetical protein